MCEPRGLFLLCFKPWYNELFQTVDTLSCSERGLQLTFILNPVVHCRCYDRLSLLILFQLFLHKQFVLPHFLSEFCDIVLGPFSHCHSIPVLPHCFETLWEDYQRVTSRLLLRKEQDEVKLVLPPSQESQQDRTIEEPRNIALLGQQEC